jgi:AraC-like DNA-binding protein
MSQLGRSAGLTGFLDLCTEVGVDAYALARAVGLPGEVLTNPDLRVSVEAMGRMFEMAAEQSGEADFALRVAETRRISNMGPVGLVIREQPTVRAALEIYARYQWLQNDAYALSVRVFGDRAMLKISGPAWQKRQTAELSVATALRTLGSLMGAAWKPVEIWFTHAAPARLETHRRVLGLTPRFDQEEMAVIFAAGDLDREIPSADPEMARQLTRYLESLASTRRVDLADKVGELILALLPDGACSVERVADHLGMDRRTLHRRLAAGGVTYTGILDATRREMAAVLLLESDRPLQQISDLMGFSSLSAFAHWFRRHFGQSASAYRASRPARVAA